MNTFAERLAYGEEGEQECVDLILSLKNPNVEEVLFTNDLYDSSVDGSISVFNAIHGDIIINTKDEFIRVDVKRVENPAHWGNRKKSFVVDIASIDRFQGDVYIGCDPDMTEFFVVQKELVKKYGYQGFSPSGEQWKFKSVDILKPEFKAMGLKTWVKNNCPTSW